MSNGVFLLVLLGSLGLTVGAWMMFEAARLAGVRSSEFGFAAVMTSTCAVALYVSVHVVTYSAPTPAGGSDSMEDIYWQRYQRGEYKETGGMSPEDLDRIRREAREESDRRNGAMTGADGRPTYRCPTCGGDVRECGGGGLTDLGCRRKAQP